MEQRNGRVDRHGQRATEVRIFHFVAAGYRESIRRGGSVPGDLAGDLEFLMRAAIKVNQIREDLGNVGDVIAHRVEEAMLGKRRDLGEPEKDNKRADAARAMLRFERKLKEQLERLHTQLRESREELRLSPENLEAVVGVGLALAGHPPLRPATIPGPNGKGSVAVWAVPALGGTWAPCAEGLLHPHTQMVRPITFDHAVASGRDDVVLAHLNHRLVQMCLRLLRAEVWAPEGSAKLHRVSARVVPNDRVEHVSLIAHGRLVLTGADSARLHEEVLVAGGSLREGRFVRANVTETKALADAARAVGARSAPEGVCRRLAELWPGQAEAVEAALQVRMRERSRSLETMLAERAKKEAADLTHVLEELRRSILAELGAKPPVQLALWAEPEKEQLERNRDALRTRADAVPAEIVRETQAIRDRYATITPRLFPIALSYIVPERLSR
jgi:hypothetical protein